jgi:hypothetical protein
MCETDVLGEDKFIIIDTELIECEIGAEVEETVEHWAYNTSHNHIAALRLIKLTLVLM